MVESNVMAVTSRTELKPPVGVIESLTTGFETVASHIGLILLPVALDLFLWLGPHLSINPLMKRLIANTVLSTDPATAQSQQAMVEIFQLIGEQANVFSFLSTAPVGVPSLMAAQGPVTLPGGQPLLLPVNNG